MTFFQGRRDGAEVIPGRLGRGPAHSEPAIDFAAVALYALSLPA